ncbi:MAG: 50S ribosomal protein L25 [Candidatus Pacebacteria bacterium]|nr:50S ribosomal protein L25 [Candidatus Paceibacterota bacterium]
MLTLNAKIREERGKKNAALREKGEVPAVLYGPKTKSMSLQVNGKEFEKIYKEAGESSLIQLSAEGKQFMVMIHSVESNPFSRKATHVDFYQPNLDEEIVAAVPLVFTGEAPAVKSLAGTLVKNIHEVEIKALPQDLPHEIAVSLETLNTFKDSILVKDLKLPEKVKVENNPEETVAFVAEPEKIEEDLEKPIEEKVEEVEKVEVKKEKPEEEKETK